MKKRILITGASGFIGQALLKFIDTRRLSFDLCAVALHPQKSQVPILKCDFLQEKKVFQLLSSTTPDYIIHLVGGRRLKKEDMFESNFMTTQILFDSIQKLRGYKPRVLIPGTAAEYGSWQKAGLVKEETRCHPASWYGFVKYMQTSLGLMYARGGLDIVVARMFNILGSGVPVTLAIGKFAQEIVKIEQKIVPAVLETRNLDGKRDFLDIDDVCYGLLMIAQHGKKGEIYNLCSSRAYVIRQLLQKLFSYSAVKNIEIKEEKEKFSDSYDVIGSNAKIKRIFNWKPRVSVEESLKKSLEYYRDRLKETVD